MSSVDQRTYIQREFNGLFLSEAGIDEIAAMLNQHPWLPNAEFLGKPPQWLARAAKRHSVEVLELLIDAGCDVNEFPPGTSETALSNAFAFDNYDVIPFLLKQGADPNKCRCLVSVVNISDRDVQLRMLKLLLKHKVDVNQVFSAYGDYMLAMTVLDDFENDEEIRGLLLDHGAKTAAEVTGKADEVMDPLLTYMRDNFGKVADGYWDHHVAHGIPCEVHRAEGKGLLKKKSDTLFTYGLSWKKMKSKQYRFGEVFIQLPKGFSLGGEDGETWPVDWLFRCANSPIKHGKSLGTATVIGGKGTSPIIPDTEFTNMLLHVDDSFERPDGETVHLYRMTPIYLEEYQFYKESGPQALIDMLSRQSLVYSPDRKSVV